MPDGNNYQTDDFSNLVNKKYSNDQNLCNLKFDKRP